MQVTKHGTNVIRVSAPKELDLFICSDVHFDSLKCDRESFKAHLDHVKEQGGQTLIIGDLFDVMGCYKDPRSKPEDIDPKYVRRGRSYLDLVVEDAYEFLKPYKENILVITYGNHETSILRHRDTDPLERLIFLLNQNEGKPVHKGAYAGWILFDMHYSSTSRSSFKIAYHHGKGGNAKRSKGILYSQLDAMEYPDANMIVSGHDHNKLYDPSNVRRRITAQNGVVSTYQDTVHWIKTGSYKKSSDDFGWEVQSGFSPKRLGGWFVKLKMVKSNNTVAIVPTVTEAVPLF